MKALCIRTKMIGGGTSYDVYWRCKDKPSRPLHGYQYATVICRGGGEYYSTRDAIDKRERWSMDAGIEKWEAGKLLDKRASRLETRIAKRAFPELKGLRALPDFWASYTMPSAEVWVDVNIELPE